MGNFRRSRFPSQSGTVRHRSSWEVGPETSGGGGPQAFSGTGPILAGTAVTITIDSLTLIRTRGEFLMYLISATAAGDGFHGAIGIAKATTAAVLAGVASVPTPITEEAWEGWLYHRYFSIIAPGPMAVATAAQETLQHAGVTAAVRFEIDSKAMRKANIDESFYFCVELVQHGTAAAEFLMNSRLLTKDMG